MATTIASSSSSEPPLEIPQWLKTLPLAPEFHPTQAEFQDPISYILKIEKQASNFGICKIVPPLPPPPRKAVVSNLNRSLSARNPNSQPTFTTRHQQIGFCPRRPRPVQRPVWQSGENYTIQEFEAKAKQFERTHLKKSGKKGFSSLEIETLFWKASVDKPFTVEYANDMPGSAFVPVSAKKSRETGDGVTVGDTAWNMRGVSRSNGSLLRFMKDEIPGVTSPMVYIAMLFSWFAWHVEDHDLHSLNYMHMGAAKTWYGVPRDAGFAFEDVVRVHGYGGEVNPLVTFATLGEKTTVMSPEVLIGAGIPCCRLVQNVGEFVVTFPGAYHSGFSHGFNCGEAANIATPEWLRFAKEAAIRRASINYPPMVSHFQLLYALALKLCSRVPTNICTEPRSSRLKEKRRGEGENIVKDLFVRDVIQNNELLHILLRQGRPCVLVPQNLSKFASPDIRSGSQRKVKPRLPLLCSNNEAHGVSRDLPFDGNELDRNIRIGHLTGFQSETGKSRSMSERDRLASLSVSNDHCRSDELCTLNSMKKESDSEKESTAQGASLLEQGLFSCVTCGILSFACAAVIQPKEATARYIMSSDCSFFNDWNDGSGDQYAISNGNEDTSETNCNSGLIENSYQDGLYDVPVQSGEYQVQMADQEYQVQVTYQNHQVQVVDQNTQAQVSDHQAQVADQNHRGQVADQKIENLPHTGGQNNISSLDLLAFAYGNPSDSEEEQVATEKSASASDIGGQKLSGYGDSLLHSPELDEQDGTAEGNSHSSSKLECCNEISARYSRQTSCNRRKPRCTGFNVNVKSQQISDCETDGETPVPEELNCLTRSCRDVEDLSTGSAEFYENDVYMEHILSDPVTSSTPVSLLALSKCSHAASFGDATKYYNVDVSIKNTNTSLVQRTNEATSKKHIFCLEHALEVEKQLRPLGGAHMLLLCHPDYSKVEEEAKLLTEELGIEYDWKHILFKEANQEELEIILSALDDEEALPGNGDWAVKMGINLYYSANLSRSPLYSKQMPYNSIIYKAFGCSSRENSFAKDNVSGKGSSKQKKIVVAGKWCGKVWMSNQVHPYLAHSNMKEKDSVGFHLQAAQNLEPSSKSERKAEVNKQIERVTASSSKPSPKLNREAKMSHQFGPLLPEKKSSSAITTNMTRNRGQKRKSKIKNKATKSPKLSSLDNPFETTKTEDSSASDSPSLDARILRSEQPKKPLFQGSSVRNICKRATKRPNLPLLDSPVEGTEAENSSESDTSSQDGRILRCEQPKMPLLRGISARKTENRATNRLKSPSFFDPVDVTEAEDSSDSDTPSRGGRILRFEQHKMSLVRGISPTKIDNRATKRPKSPSFDSPVEVTEPEDSSESGSPSRGGKINKQQSKKPLLRGRSLKNIQQCGSNLQDETEGGPSTRLRRRPSKPSEVLKAKLLDQKPTLVSISKKSKEVKKAKKASSVSCNDVQNEAAEYQCDVEGCTMGFSTKQELVLHKRNICSVKGCGKKFFSHKYLVQHRRVHIDDRPLKCPWKGCKMSFKWAWARTEHIRVHTGARPYVCRETGCGQTFRFVSDFSRHKRKTGHAAKDRG